MDTNNADGEQSFRYTRPPLKRYVLLILYASCLTISTVATLLSPNVWIMPFVMYPLTLLVILYLEINYNRLNPIEVEVANDVIILRYRLRRVRTISYRDVLWLNVWPGGNHYHPYSQIKFDDGKLHGISMSYEAGRAVREAYARNMGRRPLNYDEYLRLTNGVRWFSSGPSE